MEVVLIKNEKRNHALGSDRNEQSKQEQEKKMKPAEEDSIQVCLHLVVRSDGTSFQVMTFSLPAFLSFFLPFFCSHSLFLPFAVIFLSSFLSFNCLIFPSFLCLGNAFSIPSSWDVDATMRNHGLFLCARGGGREREREGWREKGRERKKKK